MKSDINSINSIRLCMSKQHATVDDVAKAVGVNRATMYRYIKGDIKKLPASVLLKLTAVLDVSIAELIEFTGVKRSDSDEMNLLNKYIKLDKEGKKAVDAVLKEQWERFEREEGKCHTTYSYKKISLPVEWQALDDPRDNAHDDARDDAYDDTYGNPDDCPYNIYYDEEDGSVVLE